MRPARPWDAGASLGYAGASASSTSLSSESLVISNPDRRLVGERLAFFTLPCRGRVDAERNARHRDGRVSFTPTRLASDHASPTSSSRGGGRFWHGRRAQAPLK